MIPEKGRILDRVGQIGRPAALAVRAGRELRHLREPEVAVHARG